jgi:hypothetical protein
MKPFMCGEAKGSAVEVTCFLERQSVYKTVNDLRRKYPTDEAVSPMVYDVQFAVEDNRDGAASESATKAFQGTSDPLCEVPDGTWLSKVYDMLLLR